MRVFRSGILVFMANCVDYAAVLVRNVVLARLLTVEDFGIVATFSILMTLMDTAQSVGLNRMIVQDDDADSRHFQKSLHGVQLLLGGVTSLGLLALCWPYALAMGTPALVGAYAVMAAVPLIRGLGNLETYRLQRQGRFGPNVVQMLVAQPLGLLAIWPAYLWFGDYRVIIVALMVQQTTGMLLSHVITKRRFAIGYDPAIWRRALSFGWPLVINGLLMFFVLNGDRMVISNRFGPEALGWFSAAFMLTLMPMNLIAKSLQTLLLPAMARAQKDIVRLQRQYDMATSLVTLVSVGFAGGVAVFGEWLMIFLFGPKFAPAVPFLTMLAVMQGMRLARVVPAIAAMAKAETKNPLYTNIIRGLHIPLALLVAVMTQSIYLMIAVGIVGELVAAISAALLARRMVDLRSRHFVTVFLAAALVMAGVLAMTLADARPWLLMVGMAIFIFTIRDLLFHSRELLQR